MFYAGHGISHQKGVGSDFYFVLHDTTRMTDDAVLARTAVSGEELRSWLSGIAAQKQLILLDACNSGAFAEGFTRRGAAEEMDLARLSRRSGSVVIGASTEGDFAYEAAGLGHVIFTWSVLEALTGKAAANGLVTANSLKSYVDVRLPDLSLQLVNKEQYPWTFAIGQDFAIGRSVAESLRLP